MHFPFHKFGHPLNPLLQVANGILNQLFVRPPGLLLLQTLLLIYLLGQHQTPILVLLDLHPLIFYLLAQHLHHRLLALLLELNLLFETSGLDVDKSVAFLPSECVHNLVQHLPLACDLLPPPQVAHRRLLALVGSQLVPQIVHFQFLAPNLLRELSIFALFFPQLSEQGLLFLMILGRDQAPIHKHLPEMLILVVFCNFLLETFDLSLEFPRLLAVGRGGERGGER